MEHCISFNMRKVDRVVSQWYEKHLMPLGLTINQFTLLRVLTHVGPITVSELAEIMVIDRTTLTRNLKLVEKENLIRMRPGQDRRQKVIALTKAGKRRFEEALPAWQDAQTRLVEAMGGNIWDELQQRLEHIAKLTRSLEQKEGALNELPGATNQQPFK